MSRDFPTTSAYETGRFIAALPSTESIDRLTKWRSCSPSGTLRLSEEHALTRFPMISIREISFRYWSAD